MVEDRERKWLWTQRAAGDYLAELYKEEAEMGIKSEKVELVLQKIFCPPEMRWSADQLLSLEFFHA